MDQIGQLLSFAAHTAGLKFGSLQVKQSMTAPTDVETKIINQEEIRKYKETNEEQKPHGHSLSECPWGVHVRKRVFGYFKRGQHARYCSCMHFYSSARTYC